jgi:hypothetical protein
MSRRTNVLAGTLSTSQSCYTHVPLAKTATKTQPIVVAVTGGTPGATFQVRAGRVAPDGGLGSATGTFDAAGNGQAAILDVFPPSGSISALKGDTIQLGVRDLATGADIAAGSTKVTNAAIDVARKPSNPYSKRTFRLSGLTPLYGSGTLYGSYVSGKNGSKVVKRVKLGRPNACGYLKTKRVLPPRRGPHTWTLFVHKGKKLKKSRSLFYSFTVYRRYL